MKYYLFTFLFLLNGISSAQTLFSPVIPESVGLQSSVLDQMKKEFRGLIDMDSLAGIQTAIIKDGGLAYYDSYGFADLESGKKLDEKSIFRIFSMTKPLVSVALMQLVERGLVSLEDPVSKHLPEFTRMSVMLDDGNTRPATRPILVLDLLRHTSGLGYGRGSNQALIHEYSNAALHTLSTNSRYSLKVSTLPLYHDPGTDWTYGVSSNIVGALVEVLSGLSLQDYLKKYILDPLEMYDTHFQLPFEKVENFTVGYGWSEGSLAISEPYDNNRYVRDVTLFNGGGGLVSTLSDYLNFCQMLINMGIYKDTRILEEVNVEEMTRDHMAEVVLVNPETRMPFSETGFGLGFAVNDSIADRDSPIYGWGGAVGTYFRIDPDKKMAYVMMIQLSPYRHLRLRERFQNYVLEALQ